MVEEVVVEEVVVDGIVVDEIVEVIVVEAVVDEVTEETAVVPGDPTLDESVDELFAAHPRRKVRRGGRERRGHPRRRPGWFSW